MHIPVDWGNHNWRMIIFVWRFYGITITYKTTDECDELNCMVHCAVPLYCPPRNKQSKSQDTLEDDFSFSQGGICEFPGEYIILPHDCNFNICFFSAIMGGDFHLIPWFHHKNYPHPLLGNLEPRRIDGLGRCCFHFQRGDQIARPNVGQRLKRHGKQWGSFWRPGKIGSSGHVWLSNSPDISSTPSKFYIPPEKWCWKTTFPLGPGKFFRGELLNFAGVLLMKEILHQIDM